MKNTFVTFLAAILCALLFTACPNPAAPKPQPEVLSFKTDLFDEEKAKMPYIEPVSEFSITFTRELNVSTAEGSVMLYDESGSDIIKSLSVEVSDKTKLKITLKAAMEPASEYMLRVTKALESADGKVLARQYKGYALTYHPTPPPGVRKAIIVISDIHIQDKRSWTPDPNFKGYKYGLAAYDDPDRTELIKFLNEVATWDHVKELVIAGDMFDTWFLPLEKQTLIDTAGYQTSNHSSFMQVIFRDNKDLIDAFKKVADKGIDVIFVPGNHDMFVTKDDIENLHPRFKWMGEYDKKGNIAGVGKYRLNDGTYKRILIEHGHHIDFFNSPDNMSNRGYGDDYKIDDVNEKSLLPPGFFVSKLASSSDRYKFSQSVGGTYDAAFGLRGLDNVSIPRSPPSPTDVKNAFLYQGAWEGIVYNLSYVISDWYSPLFVTGIDGYTTKMPLWWVAATQGTEYFYIYNYSTREAFWKARLAHNGVTDNSWDIKSALWSGIDINVFNKAAQRIYFNNTSTLSVNERPQLVVWGHSHSPAIIKTTIEGTKLPAIYVNAGSWVDYKWVKNDSGYPDETRTYVEIIPQNDGLTSVGLYQYSKASGTPFPDVTYPRLLKKEFY